MTKATLKNTRRPAARGRGPVKVRSAAGNAHDISNFHSAQKYLSSRINVEKSRPHRIDPSVFKLDRTRALLKKLGDPQDAVRCVHVAGTKGKGSVCEMTAACLEECGYTVGLFTSPHLTDIRERIRINDRLIPHADFTRLMRDISEAEASLPKKHGEATFFELMTVLAFCYFADQAVDVAVIETGLGGRLDCTNVITPEVTAITAIGLDHVQILGKTLPEIAREKAGIFKPGVPAIVFKQSDEIMSVFREEAERVGCSLVVLSEDVDFSHRFEASPRLGPHTCVCLSSPRVQYEHFPVPLKGHHQALNCGLALGILDRLVERGFNLPSQPVVEGLAKTRIDGRLEIAWQSPRILLDVAHNPTSVGALIETIGAYIPYDSMVILFGCCADKDIASMLDEVSRGADKVIFTRSRTNPRAADPEDLAAMFRERSGKMCQTAENVSEAIDLAARAVGRGDLIAVTGSFFLVGEARKHVTALAARKTG